MSSSRSLRRLLNIFPVNSVRAERKTSDRTKIDVINSVVSKVGVNNIADFVERSMGLTTQHIFLYEHELKRLSDLPESVLTRIASY
jgi:hypothetical protein